MAVDDPIALETAEIPYVPSPYEGTVLSASKHLAISAYWFATNFLWGALLVILLPGEIKHMVPFYRVTALGLSTGISAIVAFIAPLAIGALSDRCTSKMGRRRPYMVAGMAINVVGLALMWAAYRYGKPLGDSGNLGFWGILGVLLSSPAYLTFLIAYSVVQLGNNIASASYSGIIPDLVPEHQRGTASGYMALMSQLGTLFGTVSCGVLLGGVPEGYKYGLIAAVLVGVGMITVLGTKENPLPIKPPKIHWPTYVKSLWIDPRKYPDFAWVWITRALVMLGFYSVLPFINYYLTDVIGIERPDMNASVLIAILLVASSVSGMYGGVISDRVGRKIVVYVANMVIAVMAVAFIFCKTYEQVLVCGVLFGLGFGAYTSVDWALGTDVLPSKKDAAKEMAVWHIAMTLPQTLAAPIATFLIALPGRTTTPAPSPAVWGYTVDTIQGTAGDFIGSMFSKTELPEDVIHYEHLGYAYVFLLCAVCFALGAYLLKNVRGVK